MCEFWPAKETINDPRFTKHTTIIVKAVSDWCLCGLLLFILVVHAAAYKQCFSSQSVCVWHLLLWFSPMFSLPHLFFIFITDAYVVKEETVWCVLNVFHLLHLNTSLAHWQHNIFNIYIGLSWFQKFH